MPKTRKGTTPTLNFTCPEELRERMEAAAKDDSRTLGDIIRLALDEYLTKRGY